ncbi:hypothetical protein LTR56_019685 [Elasticomyces elasticus]|nr:hypothetical protein LTR56_019685 [Elasticomyces elasticus]KAK3633986.1 hypothetical protein LTR22_019853 [Elasticomyces elasticus]KAK4911119.1 hypothetical protein LTR49_020286 [Elasticomyces elasticus]KAK5750653.1 hypothetical protein LTS12_019274 [Elasticomyces elasticus]
MNFDSATDDVWAYNEERFVHIRKALAAKKEGSMTNSQEAILNGGNPSNLESEEHVERSGEEQLEATMNTAHNEPGTRTDVNVADDSDEDPLGDLEELGRREDEDSNWDEHVDISDLMAEGVGQQEQAQTAIATPGESTAPDNATTLPKNKRPRTKNPVKWTAAEELALWSMFWAVDGKVDEETRKGLLCPKRAEIFEGWSKSNGMSGGRSWQSMEQHIHRLLGKAKAANAKDMKTYKELRAEVVKAHDDDVANRIIESAHQVVVDAVEDARIKKTTATKKSSTKKAKSKSTPSSTPIKVQPADEAAMELSESEHPAAQEQMEGSSDGVSDGNENAEDIMLIE